MEASRPSAHPSLALNLEHTLEVLTIFLREEVRRTGLNDVVVGLSGGVDSSTVVAKCREFAGQRFPTYTVRLDSKKLDESDVAGQFAESVVWGRKAAAANGRFTSNLRTLIGALVASGDIAGARACAGELLAVDPRPQLMKALDGDVDASRHGGLPPGSHRTDVDVQPRRFGGRAQNGSIAQRRSRKSRTSG